MSHDRFVTSVELAFEPDAVTAWIRLDFVTRRLVGHPMQHGPMPETDEELDRLIALRKWTARRLVN